MKSSKQSIPVFLNEDNQPVAIIYFNENRDRIIYNLVKADEEDIIDLFEYKNKKIKTNDKTINNS